MFCTNCGTKLDDGLNFCTNCGTRLTKIEEIQEKPVQKQEHNDLSSYESITVPTDKEGLKNTMFQAVISNNVAVVEACLNAGYKVNKRFSFLDSITPLGFAAIFDSNDVAKLLIQRGAPVKGLTSNCGNANHTPLMLAAINNSLTTAKILLEAGADPNASNVSSSTALKIADRMGYTEMGQLLMQYGAKVNSTRSVLMKGVLAASVLTGPAGGFRAGAAAADVDYQFLRANWI